MNQSITLIQICPKFPLYKKISKNSLHLKLAPKWKFPCEISHFLSLPKLTQNILQFQNNQI